MALLLKFEIYPEERWARELAARLPEIEIRFWPEIGDRAGIEYAVVWDPPPGLLKTLPNLRLIQSLGAGVDQLLADPELPRAVPICRLVDPTLTGRMSEYVALHVLRYHRRQPELDALQRAGVWRMLRAPVASERKVGIMGLGELGTDAARKLAALGFRVAGWSRRPKMTEAVESFHGAAGRDAFLGRSEILVCLLPLTPATENILSRELFGRLPRGAALINAARGRHLVEADLIAALDSGRLAYATLDVFRAEPLPPDHPFWRHPRITVTPHNASMLDPRAVAALVAENVRRLGAGEPLLHRVDPEAGY
jgi:glyoxylate/hydroxypyruvate reductase